MVSDTLTPDLFRLRFTTDAANHLEREVRLLGFSTSRFKAPLDAVIPTLQADRPLVTIDAAGNPMVLSDRVGPRIRLEGIDGATWVSVDEVAARIGVDRSDELEWIAPEHRSVDVGPKESVWRQALALVRHDSQDIWAITIYAVAVGILSLALPVTAQVLVNTVAFGTVVQPIVVLSMLLFFGLVFAASLRALQTWVVELVQRRVFVRLVSSLSDRLPRVHAAAFERAHGPELVNRFFDVFTAQKAIASLLLGGIESALTVLVGLLVLSFYHPVLLGFGVIILLAVALVFLLGRGAAKTSVVESKKKFAVAGWMEEMARHLFALKLSGGEEYARKRLDALASSWLEARASHFRVVFRQVLGALGVQVVASVALLGIGGWLVVGRELTIGQLVAAELIVTAVVGALSKLGGKLEAAYDLAAAADKLGVLLRLPVERDEGDVPNWGEGPLSIDFQQVEWEGGSATLTWRFGAGETIGVLGSDKYRRAIVELLFGLRAPTSGALLVGGHDTREVDLRALRERVAVVSDPEILPGTIADNIRLARPDLPSADLWRLLEQTGLAAEVRSLPDGLQTEVTPMGAPLSRRGRLRLTLARALASNPSVLVLDGVHEALSLGTQRLQSLVAEGSRTVLILGSDPASLPAVDRVERLGVQA